MSTLPNSAVLFPDWKQEINRRVAAHKSAKGASCGTSVVPAVGHPLGATAAKAAARVAARFATAPSYSEMLAREARAAVDAAKAAARAAEEAQAAFQFVLDGLEAAPDAPDWQMEGMPERASTPTPSTLAPERVREVPQTLAEAVIGAPGESAVFWETAASSQQEEFDPHDRTSHDVVRRHELPSVAEASATGPLEGVKPIYANLIEFPRPMVAARRARPRLAEGPLAASDSVPQLSIFEVDPAAISTAPPPAAEDLSAPPSWMRTEWPALADEWLPAPDSDSMRSARLPESAASAVDSSSSTASMSDAGGDAAQTILDAQAWENFTADFWRDDDAAARSMAASGIEVAPLNRRLLAVVVDGALSTAMLVCGALWAVPHVSQLPGPRVIALTAVFALLAAGFVYHACFFTLFRSTPGMRYAGIEFDTLSGGAPLRKRRWSRLMAMLLSLVPLGLGFVWALFDEEGLAWHDRLSGTYLRRR